MTLDMSRKLPLIAIAAILALLAPAEIKGHPSVSHQMMIPILLSETLYSKIILIVMIISGQEL